MAEGAAGFAPALTVDAVAYAARANAPLHARVDAAVRALTAAVAADASDAAALDSAAELLARIDPDAGARVRTPDRASFGALLAARAASAGGPHFEQTLFGDNRPTAVSAASPLERLTAREAEILELLAQGLTNKEIAQRFVLSPRTVETHVARILGKVGVNSRSRAIAAYMRKTTDGQVGLARL
jgi:DNA-binding NarL/FixJ family response regulator